MDLSIFDGILFPEPADDYHERSRNGEYVSSHMLALYRRDPALYRARLNGDMPDTDATHFAFGRAAHAYILEGAEAFMRGFIVGGPINLKTGKVYGRETAAFAAWLVEQADGRQVVSQEEYDTIVDMSYAIFQHEHARRLIERPGIVEHVARARVCGVDCQVRPDKVTIIDGEPVIIDLKTTSDLDRFTYDAAAYGYLHQLAFYAHVLEVAANLNRGSVGARIVAVEKVAPYRVGVFILSMEGLDAAKEDNFTALQEIGRLPVAAMVGKYDLPLALNYPRKWSN